MSKAKRIIAMFALVAAVGVLGVSPLEAQCAMCRTALTESAEGRQLAGGFNTAILVLLGAPYLVFGTLVGSLWFSRRRRPSPSPRNKI